MPHYTEYRLDLDPILRIYCERYTSSPSQVLQEMERQTHLTEVKKMDASDMLQGRLLSMLSWLIRPRVVLEIGTFRAYATGCLSEGLAENGKIISIEHKEVFAKAVEHNLEALGISPKVDMRWGDAKTIIPSIDEELDLVFIDAAKHDYATFYDLIFDKVRAGGLIIADNTLWKGRVLKEKKDKMSTSVHLFNEKVKRDTRVEVLLLPYRDGISIIRKK